MKLVRGATDLVTPRQESLRLDGYACGDSRRPRTFTPCPAAPRPAAPRPWQGSYMSMIPAIPAQLTLGKGHGHDHTAILANGIRRLWEPPT